MTFFKVFWQRVSRTVIDPDYFPGVITPAPIDTRIWSVHFSDRPALETLNRLLTIDDLRCNADLRTYLPYQLLRKADGLIPEEPGVYKRTLEQWVTITHVLMTYCIHQQESDKPLLDGVDPAQLIEHLTDLRFAYRELLPKP